MTQAASSDQTARALTELLRGQGAHADPVACVEDLPTATAARLVAGYPHSIWQNVLHMNYWMEYELSRISGQRPPYPEHASESWPENPPPDEALWRECVGHFVSLISDFAVLAKSSPEVLQRLVDPSHSSEARHASSVAAVISQMVAHNSYHTGQIALLRRMLGAWPPKGGGDSW